MFSTRYPQVYPLDVSIFDHFSTSDTPLGYVVCSVISPPLYLSFSVVISRVPTAFSLCVLLSVTHMFDDLLTSGITDYQYWYRSYLDIASRFSDDGDALFDYLMGYDGPGAFYWHTALVLFGPALPPLAGPEPPNGAPIIPD